ncbi:MAG: type II secretion system F family protein [Candidatus Aenigmatarchaeota archaeon]
MKKKRIPFVPLPLEKAKTLTRRYVGIGESLTVFSPTLEFQLKHSEMDVSPREWMGIAFATGLLYFILFFVFVLVFGLGFRLELARSFLIAVGVGGALGFVSFIYLMIYPRLFVNRKVKAIDGFLPHTLHHFLVQVRSGVTLFDSMMSIARSEYGEVSAEFKKAVNEINTGRSEIEALELLARDNASLYFRRILWQLINALKSGADIGDTLKEIVDNLVMEQKVAIKKYGSELNPLALFYMVLVVVFPTLGIIFILVLFSFVGTVFNVELVLLGILGTVTLFQFMFMGLIKSKRPPGI